MVFSREQAIQLMNNWGLAKIPFLFIIDFEMKAIRLFPTDKGLPENIAYSFSATEDDFHQQKLTKPFFFKKSPVSFQTYQHAFENVKNQIRAGNSFLLNLTFPTHIESGLSIREIYEMGSARYKLLVDNEFVVFSPETFVKIQNGYISSYPMKGTIKAAVINAEEQILNNPKEIAEHHTIVDLIRNDLSMVASGVSVKRFRYIDRIATNEGDILQVSSEIIGKLPENYCTRLGNILFTLLPAGSVTGAPKPKTLEIIRSVEKTERGYYTGICGYFDGQNLDSAVMIRFIECRNGKLWFRSGGGITFSSDPKSEYQELIDKVYVPVV